MSGFRCSRDKDLESFLHHSAIPYEKREMARVYLAISDDDAILGYFSISMRCGVVPQDAQISNTMKRKLNVQPETNVAQMFLIGQLGRADSSEPGFGRSLIVKAFNLIREANRIIGCPIVRIDCKPELVSYYETYGFQSVRLNNDGSLMMMVCVLKDNYAWESNGDL